MQIEFFIGNSKVALKETQIQRQKKKQNYMDKKDKKVIAFCVHKIEAMQQ